MRSDTARRVGTGVLVLLLLIPGVTWAQSGIAGTVRDATGAVLPGVTVEASSPALIEKVRTIFTNNEGRYQVVDLRPGTYTVTFTLAGFSTVRRDGIELPASFTATVDAELRVGAVAETITVSGQAPSVDVRNSTQRQVLSDEFIEALPTLRGPQMYVAALPAVTGIGSQLGANGRVSRNMSIHNSRTGEAVMAIDGFGVEHLLGAGGSSGAFYMNQAIVEEITVSLGTGAAEYRTGGIIEDVIPKEGSNTFSGAFFANFTNEALQADNLTDELTARGLTSVNKHSKYWDLNPAFGGPILQDKLWFYSAARYAGTIDTVAGMYHDTDPRDWVFTPDLSRPALNDVIDYDFNTRLTWQATPRNKIGVFYEAQPRVLHYRNIDTLGGVAVTPEATTVGWYYPNAIGQVVWKFPMTSRLLLESGIQAFIVDTNPRFRGQYADAVVGAFDQALSLEFRGPASTGNNSVRHDVYHTYKSRAAASYITGSHAFKVGMDVRWGTQRSSDESIGSMQMTLAQGVPRSVTLVAAPRHWAQDVDADLGLYAQDQWTFNRATLGLGLRYDYFNVSFPHQELPAGRFVPTRSYPAVKDVVSFHDLSPRLGLTYDLFGDSKTALKVTFNRYVAGLGTSFADNQNPALTGVTTATRTWNDVNGNYELDCDLLRPELNGECGRLSNVDFGKANPRATITDPDILRGFGKRNYNWETSAVLEREIVSRVTANVGYFRRWYGNFTVTENLEVTPADYDPYCITAPTDPRLPDGGGKQICALYNVTPRKFGQVQNYITFAKNFPGTRREIYNGVDFTMNVRLAKGGQISGGLSTGRTAVSNCVVVDSPEDARFCDVTPPFLNRVKFMAAYPLPWWGLQTAAVFQNVPGPEITATYVARNAEIRPTLGRDLASGPTGTVNVPLIAPGTMYDKRATQLDLRVGKVFTVGGTRVRADLDLFNLFNGSGVNSHINVYGPNWLRPRDIQPARFVQFNTVVTF